MITNIIKEAIKNFPRVANSTVQMMYNNREINEFAVTDINNNIVVVVNNIPKPPYHSIDDWKKGMIVDHICMATNPESKDKDNKEITFQSLSNMIDNIINQNVVLWAMEIDTEKPIIEIL